MRDIRRFFGAVHAADRRMSAVWWSLVGLRGLLPAAFAVAMGVLVAAVEDGRDPRAGPDRGRRSSSSTMQVVGPGARRPVGQPRRRHVVVAARPPPRRLQRRAGSGPPRDAGARRRAVGGPRLRPRADRPEPPGGDAAASAAGSPPSPAAARRRCSSSGTAGGRRCSSAAPGCRPTTSCKAGAIWHARTDDDVDGAAATGRLRLPPRGARAGGQGGAPVRPGRLGRRAGSRRCAARLLDRSWEERRLRFRPTWWAIVLIAAANVVFFWSLASDARAGALGVGALVVFAQAAIGASALAFGEVDWWLRVSAQPVPLVLDLADKMAAAGRLDERGHAAGRRACRHRRSASRPSGSPIPAPTAPSSTASTSRSPPVDRSPSSARTVPARRPWPSCCAACTTRPQGAIRVDGVDLRDLDLASWRARVAAVFQDFVRYELTLARQRRRRAAPADDVVDGALADARAENLAALDTPLAKAYPGGTDLSGGQWQRVALARALAAVRLGAGVVLLDEPTAQLDVRGEAEVFERLLGATRGCTTVLISHRFSTVRHADLICVVEHGRVIELGSHAELIAIDGGRYRTHVRAPGVALRRRPRGRRGRRAGDARSELLPDARRPTPTCRR